MGLRFIILLPLFASCVAGLQGSHTIIPLSPRPVATSIISNSNHTNTNNSSPSAAHTPIFVTPLSPRPVSTSDLSNSSHSNTNNSQSGVLHIPSQQEIESFRSMSMDPAWVDPSRPSNKEMCEMVNKNAMGVVQEGGVGSFMERFFRKDGTMENWPKRMLSYVLENSTKTAGDFDCSSTYSDQCTGNDVGICENYSNAVFDPIRTQIVNLWAVFDNLKFDSTTNVLGESLNMTTIVEDIFPSSLTDVKNGVSAKAMILFMAAGIIAFLSLIPGIGVFFAPGAVAAAATAWAVSATTAATIITSTTSVIAGTAGFITGTIGAGMLIAYNQWGEVDRDRLQIGIDEIMSNFLGHLTDTAENLTTRAFGNKNPGTADLWKFVEMAKPNVKKPDNAEDWMAMTELLKDGDFLDVGDTKEMTKAMIKYSMDTMRVGVLREVYKGKGIVLVRFNWWTGDEEGCKKQFNEEHVFINNECWSLWQASEIPKKSKTGYQATNGALSKSVGKYKLSPEFLVKNTVDCNNNKDEIEKDLSKMVATDERLGKCTLGIYWFEACRPDYWGEAAKKSPIWKQLHMREIGPNYGKNCNSVCPPGVSTCYQNYFNCMSNPCMAAGKTP